MTDDDVIVNVALGEYRIIRTDGSTQLVNEKPRMRALHKALNCSTIDVVILKRKPMIVMVVDDTGMVDHKPVNPKATTLYHSVCKPGTAWKIHGDVAICRDGDF